MTNHFSRRDFHRLTSAALGGMMLGSAAGCGDKPQEENEAGDAATTATPVSQAKEIHVCRGLNTCKGKGADGNNQCAGQGTCATAAAHGCHAANACKGQGGCGESVGKNECKAKGECAVPLMESTWKVAREQFEQRMKEQRVEFGAAPADPAS